MEKEDHKPKHVCRFCNKRFLCGRSLGGHMRSHIANISEPKLSATKLSSATINGYGLRQKRKKTWRVADPSDDTLLLFCKQCGKGFVSCKALFGHMKSHSHKQRSSSNNNNNNISQEQDYSSSSSSSEQEEVAMSLMMLSRDMRSPWGFQQMGSEKTPKRSKLWDSHHFSRSGFMMSKSKKLDSDHDGDDEETESYKKKSKGNHECSICLKIFASGQALGGHKRSHLGVSHSREDHQSGVLIQEQVRDFNIDLNLPAVIEEDSNNNGGHCESYRSSSPWWVGGGTHKKESTLVDLNPLMV